MVFDPRRFASRGLALESGEPGAGGSRLAAVVERSVGEVLGLDRPYLLLDVEPRMMQRAGRCLVYREKLALIAKEQWKKDVTGGDVPLHLRMDGLNCRAALLAALRTLRSFGR